jgi:small subunit ribosomal protein S1
VVRTEEVVSPGDVVHVVVKEVDLPRKRISLSMKDAEGDPWVEVEEKYRVGQALDGTLEKKEKFGYFIAIEPGITGLLPASKIKAAQKPSTIEKLKPGDPVRVVIEEIQARERRMTLGTGGSRKRKIGRNSQNRGASLPPSWGEADEGDGGEKKSRRLSRVFVTQLQSPRQKT